MSYCLPEASYAHVRHQQEKSRSPLGFSLPLSWSPQLLGRAGGGHWGRVCAESAAVVVDQEMHSKGICFLMGI